MIADRPISELLATQRTVRSLEFFPPKDEAGVESLRQTAAALKRIAPDFVSVTYGAGGSTRERTAQVCRAYLRPSKSAFCRCGVPKLRGCLMPA